MNFLREDNWTPPPLDKTYTNDDCIIKEFVDKIPHTLIQLTEDGKTALEQYRQQMLRKLEQIK